MTRRRRGVPALSAALSALLLWFLGVVPAAHAEQQMIELSTDGVTWSSAQPSALFPSGMVVVPGDSVTSTLHLRSAAPTPGVLDLSMTGVHASDAEAAQAFVLTAVVDGDPVPEGTGENLSAIRFADLTDGAPLGTPVVLEPGESVRITLDIEFAPPPGGDYAQESSISANLTMTFRDSSGTVPPGQEIPVLPAPDRGASSPDPSAPERPSHVDPGPEVDPSPSQRSGEADGDGTDGASAASPATAAPPASAAAPDGSAPDGTASGGAASDGTEADCAASDSAAPGRGVLAVTGFAGGALFALAVALCGTGIVLLRRRRRRDQP